MLGIYYADSTTLSVCRPQRISSHKVFKGKAEQGKTTMGWFYGFKLFIVINGLGELVAAFLAKGNVADNNGSVMRRLFRRLKGLAFADKGFRQCEGGRRADGRRASADHQSEEEHEE